MDGREYCELQTCLFFEEVCPGLKKAHSGLMVTLEALPPGLMAHMGYLVLQLLTVELVHHWVHLPKPPKACLPASILDRKIFVETGKQRLLAVPGKDGGQILGMGGTSTFQTPWGGATN